MHTAPRHIIFTILVCTLLTVVSCAPPPQNDVRPGNRYATGFTIEQQADSSILLTVYSPWQARKVMGTYRIDKPFQRVVSNACTHVGYMKELDALASLVGITDRHLVYTPLSDSVSDLGNSMAPNLERIMLCNAELMLLSTYAEGDAMPEQLKQLNMPVVYINEWQENHPLARAEWIRVFGALTGQLAEADSIFNMVCTNYQLSIVNCQPSIVSILSGQDFCGTWYVPAGHTYMGQLFKDAGYAYRYAEDGRTQSIPLTTEQVIREFQDADIWVGVQADSLDELARIDNKHTWFKAYQTGRVYSFMKRATPTGGNDFWETGAVHPEYILHDLRFIQRDATPDSLYFLQALVFS
ncbi:MAG: ABC transporter substrate-binding protein [Paludibacteraceae bacterium]|nr:ABC transporter substrate-binding protein [Paludibacteraceae bacterium]